MTVFTVGDAALVAFSLLMAFSSSSSRFSLQQKVGTKCIEGICMIVSYLLNYAMGLELCQISKSGLFYFAVGCFFFLFKNYSKNLDLSYLIRWI